LNRCGERILGGVGTSAADPERLNEEGFEAFAARGAEDGPVVMLNLLRFKPDGGQQRYMEYGAAVGPALEKAGGRLVWAGEPAAPLLGERGWDLVALVEYPNRQAFLEMIGSPEYREIGHLRTEALELGELHPMDPAGELS
jgi:uncharacterized protein (DUF1330 family)